MLVSTIAMYQYFSVFYIYLVSLPISNNRSHSQPLRSITHPSAMHFTTLVLFTCTATVAYAQTGNATADAAMLPVCVRTCFTRGVDSVGCAITDFACHCSPAHNASIYAIALPCTAQNCTTAETQSMCPIPLQFPFPFLGSGQKLQSRKPVHPALLNQMVNSADKNVFPQLDSLLLPTSARLPSPTVPSPTVHPPALWRHHLLPQHPQRN
jgi:hypothetical protein